MNTWLLVGILVTLLLVIVVVCVLLQRTSTIKEETGFQTPEPQIVNIDGTNRTYLLTGVAAGPQVPVLLCFPGGGESCVEFANYTGIGGLEACVVIFQGQPSQTETYSWINAFPWMNLFPVDDILFVQTVLAGLGSTGNIFVTGKADGAGFAAFLAVFSDIPIKAIAVCSGAYYGTNSTTNFGTSKNFTIPLGTMPVLEIHGKIDSFMPFSGQLFDNKLALKNVAYWSLVDETLANTYTADILAYFLAWAGTSFDPTVTLWNGCKMHTTSAPAQSNSALIIIPDGDSCWSGHLNSGPNSSSSANLLFDATLAIAKFLKIQVSSSYVSPVKTDLSGLPIWSTPVI